MAVHKDDLPHGVDLEFHTNKGNTGNKLDALKKMADDPDIPFGAVVRQLKGPDGKVNSALNIVNEEGKWDTWTKSLPSQMLSKQTPALVKTQLNHTYEGRRKEFQEIAALTNPVVKRKLLESFSNETDSASVHLAAAHLPRQRTKVLLPIKSIKEDEIFAPSLRDGERVALVRFPHGGTFEIPKSRSTTRTVKPEPSSERMHLTQSASITRLLSACLAQTSMVTLYWPYLTIVVMSSPRRPLRG